LAIALDRGCRAEQVHRDGTKGGITPRTVDRPSFQLTTVHGRKPCNDAMTGE
jgi:hypothetical protein